MRGLYHIAPLQNCSDFRQDRTPDLVIHKHTTYPYDATSFISNVKSVNPFSVCIMTTPAPGIPITYNILGNES